MLKKLIVLNFSFLFILSSTNFTVAKETNSIPFLNPQEKLVAYYPFNGNANDESGNGNDGTVNGAILATDRFGNPNSAYRFDGVDDFIEIADDPSLRLGNSSYTISVWAYVEDYTNTTGHTMINKRGSANENGYLLSLYGNDRSDQKPEGQIDFIASRDNDPNILSQSILGSQQWYNITIVSSKEENTTKIYVNGALDQVGEFLNLNPNTTANLTFGRDELTATGNFNCCDGFYFNGLLDDISIYYKALSEEEIQDLYNHDNDDALIVHLPFNGNLIDQSSNEYNGTALSTLQYSESDCGQAIKIRKNDTDGVSLNGNIFNELQDFTISTYVKLDGFNSNNNLISCANESEANEFIMAYNSLEDEFQDGWHFKINDEFYFFEENDIINDFQWHHVVATRKGEEASLYIDGQQVGSTIIVDDKILDVSENGCIIGQDQDCIGGCFQSNQSWFGEIDELKVFSKALSLEEIQELVCTEENTTVRVQLIHNVADQTAQLKVNGRKAIDRVQYRTASKFVQVPTGTYVVEFSPLGTGEIYKETITLSAGKTYILIAHGTFDESDEFPVEVSILENAQTNAPNNELALQFFHGGFDAEDVDLLLEEAILFDDLTYGSFAESYQTLTANNYPFLLSAAADNQNILGAYGAKLKYRGGNSGVIFASGSINSGSFGLWIALSNGKCFPLIPLSNLSSREAVEWAAQDLMHQKNSTIENTAAIAPNPAKVQHHLDLELTQNAEITITLLNAQGQIMNTVFQGYKEVGIHYFEQNLEELVGGIYFYEIKIGADRIVKQFVVE